PLGVALFRGRSPGSRDCCPEGAAAVLRLPQHGLGVGPDDASDSRVVGSAGPGRRGAPPPPPAAQPAGGNGHRARRLLGGGWAARSRGAAVVRSDAPPYVERTQADRAVAARPRPDTWVTRC